MQPDPQLNLRPGESEDAYDPILALLDLTRQVTGAASCALCVLGAEVLEVQTRGAAESDPAWDTLLERLHRRALAGYETLVVRRDAFTDPQRSPRTYAAIPLPVAPLDSHRACLALWSAEDFDLHEAAERTLRGLAGMAHSLLQGRRSAERLRLQEARVRTASMAASDWLWETDAQGRVTWLTDNIIRHTGVPAPVELGRDKLGLYQASAGKHADDWAQLCDAFHNRRAFANLVADRQTPQGLITVSISGLPTHDSLNRFKGFRGSSRDITQQVRSQTRMDRTQDLMSLALESFPGAVMITDANGRVLLHNTRWREVVGPALGELIDDPERLTWEEVVRRLTYAGYYPDATGHEEEFITWRLSLASEEPEARELRVRDRWSLTSDKILPDGSVLHLFIDITERKSYELALADSETQLRLSQSRLNVVLQAIPDLLFVLDPDGRFLECPTPGHPMLVRPFLELQGASIVETSPGLVGRQIDAALRALHATGHPQRLEYELTTRDGQLRTFEARLEPMPHEHVLFLTRDLTELRALKRDVALMEGVLEAESSLPLMLVDAQLPERPIIYANPAFERLTGTDRRDTVGSDWRHFVEANPAGLLELEQAMEAGAGAAVIVAVERDGASLLHEWQLSPVRDEHKQVTHFIFVVRDVTERTREAEMLRVSEEIYRSLALAISDGLVVASLDGRIAAINPAACRILGVRHDDVIGQRDPLPFTLMDSQQRTVPRQRLPVHRVLKGEAAVVEETWAVKRPDGQIRWLSLSCHPLRLAPDQPLFSAVATFRDITETRQAAQALKASEERWSFALEGAEHGVWDWDILANKSYFSRRWRAIMGYENQAVIEHHARAVFDRVHAEDVEGARRALKRHLQGQSEVFEAEYRIHRPDGSIAWVLDRGKVVAHAEDGRPARMVGTLSDVTRNKEAEQALRDKQAAEVASRAKSEFLSRMSHEMRTPLNAVLGFAQLLRLEPDAGMNVQQNYIDHIMRAGQHLLALINDVLDLQRVEEGRVSLDLQLVSLDHIVDGCIELLGPQAQAHEVHFERRIEPGLVVRADERRLRQVLLNIGSNAVKYNRSGGAVRWLLDTLSPHSLTLSIEDDGPGMSAAQLDRLFQPFERLGRETSNIEGTGLGLIIARRLTQEMGGGLDVRSAPGTGTRVLITLPREHAAIATLDPVPPPAADAPTLPAPKPADESPRKLRLLYVEDNRINALLFEQALHLHPGIELKIAEDGQHALEITTDWTPDVLVLDAHLPGMSGYEALLALREREPMAHTPAYMCSADAMPEDIQRAKDAGFVGYWTKPIDIKQVLKELERHLHELVPAAG